MVRRSIKSPKPLSLVITRSLTVSLAEKPSKAFAPRKHVPELKGRAGWGVSLEVLYPPLGRARTTWSLRAPFTKPRRRGKIESPAWGQPRLKKSYAQGSIWNNAGERGAAGFPGKGGLRPQDPEGSGGPGPRSEARIRLAGSGDHQTRPAQPEPAYLLYWGSVHGACSRNGPV